MLNPENIIPNYYDFQIKGFYKYFPNAHPHEFIVGIDGVTEMVYHASVTPGDIPYVDIVQKGKTKRYYRPDVVLFD